MPDKKTALFWWGAVVSGLVHILDGANFEITRPLVDILQKPFAFLAETIPFDVNVQLIVGLITVICGLLVWKDMMK